MPQLVLHISDWSWRRNEPVVEEVHDWLAEHGLTASSIDVHVDPDESSYPVRLTVTLGMPASPEVAEQALAVRLRMAWDVVAQTSTEMASIRSRLDAGRAAEAYRLEHAVAYDADGLRSDIPAHLRGLLDAPQSLDPADPNLWPEPTYSSADPGYLERLTWADYGMYLWDHDALWRHRVDPQTPGHLVFECNDDGLMATEVPALVCHVHGLDGMPPYLNRFTEPVRVDDLLQQTLHRFHRRLQRDADGLLLRESHVARFIDEPYDARDPARRPPAVIGSMSGWVVHSGAIPVYAEPYGANNARFAGSRAVINEFLAKVGDTSVEWATWHDLVVTGRVMPEIDLGLRMFLADILIDLIAARSGGLRCRPGDSWPRWPADAIAEGTAVLRGELVVLGRSLFEVRQQVAAFAGDAPRLFDIATYRASRGNRADRYPPSAITVEFETVKDREGHEAVQRLARLLGVPAEVTEADGAGGWTKRVIGGKA